MISNYIVKHKIEVKDEETGSSLIILPDEKFSVNVLISFDSPVLSNQFATMNDLSEFPEEIAASRTFHGVTKSGSPTESEMISFISLAISKNFRIPEGGISSTVFAINFLTA